MNRLLQNPAPKFVIIGSASMDFINFHSEPFSGTKETADRTELRPGGGAFNMLEGVKRLTRAMNIRPNIDIFTMIGPRNGFCDQGQVRQNPFAPQMYDAAEGFSLHDLVRHQSYAVCPNAVTVVDGERTISKNATSAQFNDQAITCDEEALEILQMKAAEADILLIQPRYIEASIIAAQAASDDAIIIVDADLRGEAFNRVKPILNRATHIIAPGESLPPGQEQQDPQALLTYLNTFERAEMVAVSDGGEPVPYIVDGTEGIIPVAPIERKIDDLGAGDHRDAFWAVGLSQGLQPTEALRQANILTARFIQYYGDEWEEGLQDFLVEQELLNMSLPNDTEPRPKA